MSIRDDAIADLLAATSPSVLGQKIVVDNVTINAVVKSLTAEEVTHFDFDGMAGEGIRLTFSASALPYVPVVGQQLDVGGVVWDVKRANVNGGRLRVVLLRYVS